MPVGKDAKFMANLWYEFTMKTTIDSAGRVVVPKSLPQALNLKPGQFLEIRIPCNAPAVTVVECHEAVERRVMAPIIARCTCGKVELAATGTPITSVVCYCDDCQTGAQQIEALPNAARVREPDDGVGYVVYRKDRVRILKGAELLRGYKIRQNSATNRMVATCCNTAMILTFDDSKHWVDVYRAAVIGNFPPLQMKICTKYRKAGVLDTTVPAFSKYPLRLVAKLLAARIAMLLGAE